MAKKLKTSKRKQVDLDVSGLADNQMLVNHMKNVAYEMISCRSQMGVDAELEYCQQIIDDNLVCEDKEVLECEKEINQAIDGITSSKRDDAISIHTDLIIGQLDKLFKISPTPIPDLPKREEDVVIQVIEDLINQQVADRLEEAILGFMEQRAADGEIVSYGEAQKEILDNKVPFAPSEDEIFKIAKAFKGKALNFIHKRATTGAKRMEKAIHDIVVETDFGAEMLEFIQDFDSYPYAVLRTGSHLPFARKVWKGNTWVIEDQMLPVAKRVAPHNFYWSSDSLKIDDGTAVGDIVYLKRSDLERMYNFEKNKAMKENIAECVTMCNSFKSWREWTDYLGHTEENKNDDACAWETGVTVPCFRIHTLLDSCDLEEMGVEIEGKGDKLSQYEVEAWLLNEKIVRFKAFDPKGHRRPYALEKFRHIPGQLHGKSLAYILRPVEMQIRAVKRNELLNIGFSSAPVTLIDETAFNIDEDEMPEVVQPGDNYRVKSYPGRTMKPIEYQIIPNITGQLRVVLSDLQAEADVKSQIPRLLTGQGQLGSSIRSASMLATQISGASKNLKRQIWLIAANVIKPYIETVFEYYMQQGIDKDAKIDAAVKIGSIESLVNREFLVQHIQSLIQYLAPYVQQGLVPASVIQQLLFTLMSETGISEDSNNAEILDELQGIVNDVSSNVGLPNASGGPQLDGRSNFQPIDTGSLGR